MVAAAQDDPRKIRRLDADKEEEHLDDEGGW